MGEGFLAPSSLPDSSSPGLDPGAVVLLCTLWVCVQGCVVPVDHEDREHKMNEIQFILLGIYNSDEESRWNRGKVRGSKWTQRTVTALAIFHLLPPDSRPPIFC